MKFAHLNIRQSPFLTDTVILLSPPLSVETAIVVPSDLTEAEVEQAVQILVDGLIREKRVAVLKDLGWAP